MSVSSSRTGGDKRGGFDMIPDVVEKNTTKEYEAGVELGGVQQRVIWVVIMLHYLRDKLTDYSSC